MHRYDDEGRSDGLKRLIAGRDIHEWGVPKGKKGGLISEATFISEDAWVDAGSTIHDSHISGWSLVKDSKVSDSVVKNCVIQSSTVHESILRATFCDLANVSFSILYSSVVTVNRLSSVDRRSRADLKTVAAELTDEALGRQHLDEVEGSTVEYSILNGTQISLDSKVKHSGVGSADILRSTVDYSKLDDSWVSDATVSSSFVRSSNLSDRVVREARVSRLSRDAHIGQLRFPIKSTLDRSAELSGGYFGDFPAQIDIWPRLPGRLRQIAVLAWIVGVPWAFWTTPLLSIIIAVPLLALVVLRLASGLASRIVGKLEARSMSKATLGRGRSGVSAALKSCSTAFSSLKKLLNGLLLAGTVLVPTAIVSGAVVERMLNSDAEPSRSAEVVDSVSADVGSDTVVSDDFDRDASSSTASSEPAVPTPVSVTSSNLRAVAYDPEHSYLYVWFHSGGLYRYNGVPEAVYRNLLVASSKGRFHASYIRDQYTSVRLS